LTQKSLFLSDIFLIRHHPDINIAPHKSSTMATTPSFPAMRATPTVKVMDRKYDADGKVTNWSANWPEA
jgi:hypothetical protein